MLYQLHIALKIGCVTLLHDMTKQPIPIIQLAAHIDLEPISASDTSLLPCNS